MYRRVAASGAIVVPRLASSFCIWFCNLRAALAGMV